MNLSDACGQLRLQIGGEEILPRIQVADSFRLRSLGLMGRKEVPAAYGAGLFFPNCRSLHACFMRFDLHVWFLDAHGQPVCESKTLKPWQAVVGPKGSVHCMEITPGFLGYKPTDEWSWEQEVASQSLRG